MVSRQKQFAFEILPWRDLFCSLEHIREQPLLHFCVKAAVLFFLLRHPLGFAALRFEIRLSTLISQIGGILNEF